MYTIDAAINSDIVSEIASDSSATKTFHFNYDISFKIANIMRPRQMRPRRMRPRQMRPRRVVVSPELCKTGEGRHSNGYCVQLAESF